MLFVKYSFNEYSTLPSYDHQEASLEIRADVKHYEKKGLTTQSSEKTSKIF